MKNFFFVLFCFYFVLSKEQEREGRREGEEEEEEEEEEEGRYPWGKGYQFKQNLLLNKLKYSSLNILSNYLPLELKESSLSYSNNNNNQNNNFTCSVLTQNSLEILSQKQNEELILNLFKNICLSFNVDWWSYEWCSEKEVRQFHIEVKRKNQIQKNPNWSLGKYDETDVERDENGFITKVIQYYSNGQICHENNHLRSSEIHLVCCDANRQDRRSPLDIPVEQLASFSAQHETNLCEYQIELCSPLMCPNVMYHSTHQPPLQHSLVDFMKNLEKSCMSRQESWWTYEVCFRPSNLIQEQKQIITDNEEGGLQQQEQQQQQQFTSGARQFRVNTMLVQEGKQIKYTQSIEAEFFLGSPPSNLYNNETALREVVVVPRHTVVHRVGSSLSHQSSSVAPIAALHIEFTGGKACDIENTLRGATMEITCGPRDGIEDIIEDKTCHYLFKISSKSLCLVEGFAPPKQNISQVVCQQQISPSHSDDNINNNNDNNNNNMNNNNNNNQENLINHVNENNQQQSDNQIIGENNQEIQKSSKSNHQFQEREL